MKFTSLGRKAIMGMVGMACAFTASAAGPGYLDCNGTGYMRIPNHDDFTVAVGQSMSVSFRYYLNAWAASNSYQGLVCNNFRNTAGVRSGFDLFSGSSAAQTLANNLVPNSGSTSQANNIGGAYITSGYTPGQWATAVWTYNGATGNSKIYINGVALRETTGTQLNYPITSFADILVGARWVLNDEPTTNINGILNGRIDDLRFYSRELTAAEVAAESTITVDESTPDLIAAYDFSDLSTTTVRDISGNGHDATLVGIAAYVEGPTVNIRQTEGGTLEIYDGSTLLIDGQNIAAGTELTFVATPSTYYTLDAIYVNDTRITGDSYTVGDDVDQLTFRAEFARQASAPTKVLVFDMNEDGSRYYRIPAVAVAADGSIVALADKRGESLADLPNTISVVAKRSTDGGKTWSSAVTVAQGNSATGKTYGDPAVVLDKNTGNLVAVFSGDTGFFVSNRTNRAGFYVSKSTDNGITWSEPRAITDQLYQSNWYGAFAASGSMLQTADGTIMFVANTRTTAATDNSSVYEFVCASSDGGDTWSVLNADARIPAAGNGNESKLVETPDGELIMSIRSAANRRFSRSTDGGRTWSAATAVNDLVEPNCNGDIIMYPSKDGQSRMLHSIPFNASTRRDVSVLLSYDNGSSWPIRKQLSDTYSAYSSLCVLEDGSIGCFVEEGKWDSNIAGDDGFRLYFMNFSLEWLTDGQDTDNPDAAPSYTLTINQPEEGGSIAVFNGDDELANGIKVNDGTTLNVVATPADEWWTLEAIYVNGSAIESTSFVMEGNTAVTASFVRSADAPLDYCYAEGNSTYAGSTRGIVTFTISDDQGNSMTVNGPGSANGHAVYVDRTENTFTTVAGATLSFTGTANNTEWMHNYVYIDFGNDGVFDVDQSLTSINGDLVAHSGYNTAAKSDGTDTADPTTDSSGRPVNHGNYFTGTPDYTLPANLKPGTYRLRLKNDWNNTDPCGRKAGHLYGYQKENYINNNGGSMIDILIRIESDEFDAPRTISVASSNDELGSVAITSPETDETSVSTAQRNVVVEATAAENATFRNWTNAAGDVVAETATYTYSDEDDVELTANFGFAINVSVNDTNLGAYYLKANNQIFANGSIVEPGDEIVLTVEPANGYAATLTVNGSKVVLQNNTFSFTAESNTTLEITFAERGYTYTLNVEGQGEVVAANTGSKNEFPAATSWYNPGADLPKNGTIRFFLSPADGYMVGRFEFVSGSTTNFYDSEDTTGRMKLAEVSGKDGWFYVQGSTTYTDDVVVNVKFIEQSAGIDSIFADGAQGEVEYFNLQGIRVAADNLTPGFYIVRKGNESHTIYINK